jgi:hypothetical protein
MLLYKFRVKKQPQKRKAKNVKRKIINAFSCEFSFCALSFALCVIALSPLFMVFQQFIHNKRIYKSRGLCVFFVLFFIDSMRLKHCVMGPCGNLLDFLRRFSYFQLMRQWVIMNYVSFGYYSNTAKVLNFASEYCKP